MQNLHGQIKKPSSLRKKIIHYVLIGLLTVRKFLLCALFLILLVFQSRLEAQKWHQTAGMATERKGLAVVVFYGKLWAIGGSQRSQRPLGTVEVYDPVTNIWNSDYPSLNHARENTTAQVYDGKIFVFGGRSGMKPVDQVEMFDPQVGHWEVVTSLQMPVYGTSSVVVDSSIWLVGGSMGRQYLDIVQVYQPNSNTWHQLEARLITPRSDPMVVRLDSIVYACGGYYFNPVNSCEFYSPAGKKWQPEGKMPIDIASAGYTCSESSAWIIGGIGRFGVSDRVWTFKSANAELFWQEGPSLAYPRRELAAAFFKNRLYAIGGRGRHDQDVTGIVEVLELETAVQNQLKITAIDNYRLAQNYPNPFATSTKIQFVLPYPENVNINLYDITGRQVLGLFAGYLSAGTFQIPLTMPVDTPAGVYFIGLNGAKHRNVLKINYLKQ